jgi:DNA invertase Pin-like site-specific DNA recombinase
MTERSSEMPRTITKIEAPALAVPALIPTAAYGRVSGSKDAQMHSLSAQISYYSDYIQRHECWEYKGVFTDEAYTGTKNNRKGLQALLSECRAGNIQQIVTKSISRFARNTVDLLNIVREMRAIGVGIYFEEQNIDTLSGDGELMLTILASYAQEESRSASENCNWRIQKRFEQGELIGWSFMYGYNIKGGVIAINEEQAVVVRRIFDLYLGGCGYQRISNMLNAEGIPAYYGGRWSANNISALLKNEKLTGSAILQKKYTENHLTKRRVINRGEKERYFAKDTHPAIISKDDFSKVQEVIAKRAAQAKARNISHLRYPYSGKILCASCGKRYRRKKGVGVFYWQCKTFLTDGRRICPAQQIPERILDDFAAELGGMSNIAEIVVPAPNRLIFRLSSGAEIEKEWSITRRDSWTDEMKEAARQKSLMRKAVKNGE